MSEKNESGEPEVGIKGRRLVSLWFKNESDELTEVLPRNCQFFYRGCLVDSGSIRIAAKTPATTTPVIAEQTRKKA